MRSKILRDSSVCFNLYSDLENMAEWLFMAYNMLEKTESLEVLV